MFERTLAYMEAPEIVDQTDELANLAARIPKELDRQVDIACAYRGVTKRAFIVEALRAALREVEAA